MLPDLDFGTVKLAWENTAAAASCATREQTTEWSNRNIEEDGVMTSQQKKEQNLRENWLQTELFRMK